MDYAGRSDSATVLSNGQVILPQLRFQQHIGSKWILFVCVSQHKCQDARNFCSAGDSCRLRMKLSFTASDQGRCIIVRYRNRVL